jgi:hypothetical protein
VLNDGEGVSLEEYFSSAAMVREVPPETETTEIHPIDFSAFGRKLAQDLSSRIPLSIRGLQTVPEMIERICSASPTLNRLFNASAQVTQGHTVRTHTLMFHRAFTDHLSLPEAKSRILAITEACPNIENIFNIAITLHDLGKAIGNKEEHHRLTWMIVNPFLRKWGYKPPEIALISALINYDIIESFIQRYSSNSSSVYDDDATMSERQKQDIETTAKQLFENHASSGGLISFGHYFYLQVLFYLSDAGSYPSLYCNVMRPVNKPFFGFKYLPNDDDHQPFLMLLKHVVATTLFNTRLISPPKSMSELRIQELLWQKWKRDHDCGYPKSDSVSRGSPECGPVVNRVVTR